MNIGWRIGLSEERERGLINKEKVTKWGGGLKVFGERGGRLSVEGVCGGSLVGNDGGWAREKGCVVWMGEVCEMGRRILRSGGAWNHMWEKEKMKSEKGPLWLSVVLGEGRGGMVTK